MQERYGQVDLQGSPEHGTFNEDALMLLLNNLSVDHSPTGRALFLLLSAYYSDHNPKMALEKLRELQRKIDATFITVWGIR